MTASQATKLNQRPNCVHIVRPHSASQMSVLLHSHNVLRRMESLNCGKWKEKESMGQKPRPRLYVEQTHARL